MGICCEGVERSDEVEWKPMRMLHPQSINGSRFTCLEFVREEHRRHVPQAYTERWLRRAGVRTSVAESLSSTRSASVCRAAHSVSLKLEEALDEVRR
jgi:hypothetical protein